jgi:predicted acetyltransferase
MDLRLRPYRLDDEAAALAINAAMVADDFMFLLGWNDTMTWSDYLAVLEDYRWGRNIRADLVRSVQLAADVAGELVGRVSIRFELNEFLATRGGHIGYGVAPAHRRRGYASEILRQALVVIRADGVSPVLVTCDEKNEGSFRAIERNGGILESTIPDGHGQLIRRYWIW